MGLETLLHKVGHDEEVRNLSVCVWGGEGGKRGGGGIVMPHIDHILIKHALYGCVISLTLGFYWVDSSFIYNYKESQLWLD